MSFRLHNSTCKCHSNHKDSIPIYLMWPIQNSIMFILKSIIFNRIANNVLCHNIDPMKLKFVDKTLNVKNLVTLVVNINQVLTWMEMDIKWLCQLVPTTVDWIIFVSVKFPNFVDKTNLTIKSFCLMTAKIAGDNCWKTFRIILY